MASAVSAMEGRAKAPRVRWFCFITRDLFLWVPSWSGKGHVPLCHPKHGLIAKEIAFGMKAVETAGGRTGGRGNGGCEIE